MASSVTGLGTEAVKTLPPASMPINDQDRVTEPKEQELSPEQIAAEKAIKRAEELNGQLTQLTTRKKANQESMSKVNARIEFLNENFEARLGVASEEKKALEAEANLIDGELEGIKKELEILKKKYPTWSSYLWSFAGY